MEVFTVYTRPGIVSMNVNGLKSALENPPLKQQIAVLQYIYRPLLA